NVAPGRPANAPSPKAQAIPGVKHVIAVASGKGGVGKSTTACNLALGLQAQGLKVGLLDADIYGPSMPKLFGLHGKPRVIEGRILEPLDGYGVKVMSIGFMVEQETPIIGLVENMATFVCPHCGQESHIFGHGGARTEAARLGVPFLGEVPLNMTIRETSDSGRPVVAIDPDGPHGRVYRDIAAQLWA